MHFPEAELDAGLHCSTLLYAANKLAVYDRIGDRSKKDPHHYSTMSSLFHSKPHRMLSQPNPEIAADASRRQHSKLGIYPQSKKH